MRRAENAAGRANAPTACMPTAVGATDGCSVARAPLAVDAVGLGELLGCSERHVRKLNASGRLPRPVRLGRRTLWPVAEIEAWLRAGAPGRSNWEARKRDGGGA